MFFYETRLLALCSTPITLEDQGFSVGGISLSWYVPINAIINKWRLKLRMNKENYY
jgi:hypothetical protein